MKITYQEFQNAIKIFDLIGLETKKDIKKRYLKLSKQYHPDKQNGSNEKFQQINDAYKTLEYYIDNFKFQFSQDEFQTQYPFSKKENGQWSLW